VSAGLATAWSASAAARASPGRGDGGGLDLEIEAAPGLCVAGRRRGARSRGLAALECLLAAFHSEPAPGLPRFWGGLVGVWGHDMVRVFEQFPPAHGRRAAQRPAGARSGRVGHGGGVRQLQPARADRGGRVPRERRRSRRRDHGRAGPRRRGRGAARQPAHAAPAAPAELRARCLWQRRRPWTREGFLAAVRSARAYISAGDIFQVVLSQRFTAPRGRTGVVDLYRMLRVTNPAPYMYLFELPSATLIGASPEVLVRLDREPLAPPSGAQHDAPPAQGGLRVTLRPIAGTRPRGKDTGEDEALACELLADAKERAEHLMLVDLGRNDLGRVCAPGSVRVTESFALERYSRVMHIVSEVQGELRAGLTALDALRAAFPAGTLSGAPKIRALQIIDELEPAARGWYGGAVGYLGFDGAADFAICIRSMVAPPASCGSRPARGWCSTRSPRPRTASARPRPARCCGRSPWPRRCAARADSKDRYVDARLRAPPAARRLGQRLRPTVASRAARRVLVVDNYDSFTFNLVQYLLQLGAVVDVYRNDAIDGGSGAGRSPEPRAAVPGARSAGGQRCVPGAVSRARRRRGAGDPAARGVPRAPDAVRGARGDGPARRADHARQAVADLPRRQRGVRGPALAVHGDPLPFAWWRSRRPCRRSCAGRAHRPGRADGGTPREPAAVRRAVSPGVGAQRARARAARNFLETGGMAVPG
jgi:anthranilate synthase component 1